MNMDNLYWSRHYGGCYCNWLLNNNLDDFVMLVLVLVLVLVFVLMMETSPLGVLNRFGDLNTEVVKFLGHCCCEGGCGVRCGVEECGEVLELR